MLTPEQSKEAYKLWRKGTPIKHIARDMGASYYLVRGSFDPEWKKAVLDRKKAWEGANKNRVPQPDDRVQPIFVPESVLRERDEAQSCPMTFSQIIFGDPPYTRSALARKEAHG